jgi:aerobic carbon-monoxide dehydrogenase small subunit
MTVKRRIKINGTERDIEVQPEMRLLDLIRNELKLTGTKEGCGEGECGACSVLLNGAVIDSCLMLAGQLSDGDEITTVEGLGDVSHLSPLQRCFIDKGGTQCGICTPGMLIAAHALLARNSSPSRREIAMALAGNLCRCTGYKKIIDAVEEAGRIMTASKARKANNAKKARRVVKANTTQMTKKIKKTNKARKGRR